MKLYQVIDKMHKVFEETSKDLSCDTMIDNISTLVRESENEFVCLFWCVGYKETIITRKGTRAADWCNGQPYYKAYLIDGRMVDGSMDYTFRRA